MSRNYIYSRFAHVSRLVPVTFPFLYCITLSGKFKIFYGDKVYFVTFTMVERIKVKLLNIWKGKSLC